MRQGGSEDCLYLNVFVPMEARNTSRLPCLVWIHGGGYEFGSSNMYDPTKLTSFLRSQKSPSVLVTFNYRLNVFGFLGSDHLRPLDALHSTGNYGLQDQRMALQWVQDNIMAFGGDPSKVMIFGQSAGAGSVSSHVTMPKSAGLFFTRTHGVRRLLLLGCTTYAPKGTLVPKAHESDKVCGCGLSHQPVL